MAPLLHAKAVRKYASRVRGYFVGRLPFAPGAPEDVDEVRVLLDSGALDGLINEEVEVVLNKASRGLGSMVVDRRELLRTVVSTARDRFSENWLEQWLEQHGARIRRQLGHEMRRAHLPASELDELEQQVKTELIWTLAPLVRRAKAAPNSRSSSRYQRLSSAVALRNGTTKNIATRYRVRVAKEARRLWLADPTTMLAIVASRPSPEHELEARERFYDSQRDLRLKRELLGKGATSVLLHHKRIGESQSILIGLQQQYRSSWMPRLDGRLESSPEEHATFYAMWNILAPLIGMVLPGPRTLEEYLAYPDHEKLASFEASVVKQFDGVIDDLRLVARQHLLEPLMLQHRQLKEERALALIDASVGYPKAKIAESFNWTVPQLQANLLSKQYKKTLYGIATRLWPDGFKSLLETFARSRLSLLT